MSQTHDLTLRASGKVPSQSTIESLPMGSLVKLCADQGERFWVRVTHKNGGVWTGAVVTSLVFLKVAYGDHVRFSPTNVYDYEYPDHPNPT